MMNSACMKIVEKDLYSDAQFPLIALCMKIIFYTFVTIFIVQKDII